MQENYVGKNIPKLGFGLMRLPMLGSEIDTEQVKAMVDRFMAAGFTYFDTAYVYHGGNRRWPRRKRSLSVTREKPFSWRPKCRYGW